jgi:type I restriction enzyme R subunit
LIKRLQRVAKNISADGRKLMAAFVAHGDVGKFARDLRDNLRKDWAGTMRVLRDANFLALLEDYPRPPRTVIVAHEAVDAVTSDYLFRTTDGRALKPGDYIGAFSQFVRENRVQIEALRVLLDRPSEWNTSVLNDLRLKLQTRPERFTEDNLRRAYQYE